MPLIESDGRGTLRHTSKRSVIPSRQPVIPLRFGTDADFGAVRALLAAHDYTAEGLCRRLQVASIYDVQIREPSRGQAALDDGFDALRQLFVDCGALAAADADRLLGEEALALLARLGLVREDTGHWRATVLLYPNAALYLVSDLPPGPPGEADGNDTDVVYPALTSSVRVFLSTLPSAAGARYLELCSGTGVAALLAAQQGATRAVAVDITERSTRFAEFNARLNAVSIEALQGDLFAPVDGAQFDCIVAHPPYVPSPSTQFIFRDGGADGEQITRAILARTPEFLAPGGVLHCTCLITARHQATPLQRVRAMLGAAADEFDVVLLENGVSDQYAHFVKQLVTATPDEVPGIVSQLRLFNSLRIERVELVTIIARRHGQSRPGIAVATGRSADTRWPEVAWLLQMQMFLAEGDRALDRLFEARPRLSPSVRLDLSYRFDPAADDHWIPDGGTLQVLYPLASKLSVDAGDAAFFASCDGQRTFAQILAGLQAEGKLPADLAPRAFMTPFASLVAMGVLETDLLPFPRQPS